MIVEQSQIQTPYSSFNAAQKTGSLLQSFEWGEFQSGRQQKIWRLEVKDGEKILAQMFFWKHRFLIGQNGLYCPRGPVVCDEILNDEQKLEQVLKLLFEKVRAIAKENKSLLFRIDPNVIIDAGNLPEKEKWSSLAIDEKNVWKKAFENLGLKKSNDEVQPAHTIMLDISQSEDELLAKMSQKTRYNIRLAEKKGVKVEESKDAATFFELLKQTTARQKFGAYPLKYFEDILKFDFSKLYLAKFENKVVAGILCVYYKNVATYLFGASSDKYRNVMAPHLLQWRAICDAKKEGFEIYDFWGAAPADSKVKKEKSWQGITRFKQGFDPSRPIFEYLGCYQLIFRPVVLKVWDLGYKMYKILRAR
ncbi:MAG TPA: peptidoglycan bridge formation glycyltransferase FemA/FemB family protein [Candidatus Bipolaricaulota bacterium]|nr:peptidoglycan bridge formation glycyltransferase FemA/FemB family protein [Candidatus Bipolaricaulota bacterium]